MLNNPPKIFTPLNFAKFGHTTGIADLCNDLCDKTEETFSKSFLGLKILKIKLRIFSKCFSEGRGGGGGGQVCLPSTPTIQVRIQLKSTA